MKQITEKQILQWKAELDNHKEKLKQAEAVITQELKLIAMIEGGIQFGEIVLKKTSQVIPSSNKAAINQQSEKAPSKK